MQCLPRKVQFLPVTSRQIVRLAADSQHLGGAPVRAVQMLMPVHCEHPEIGTVSRAPRCPEQDHPGQRGEAGND